MNCGSFLDMATATGTLRRRILPPTSASRPINAVMRPKRIAFGVANFFRTTSLERHVLVRASDEPQSHDHINSTTNDPNIRAFTTQEDLNYLLKLLVGSVVGAAVIKYGSIVFPEITRPNLLQALVMISTPVFVSVVLLLNQSRVER